MSLTGVKGLEDDVLKFERLKTKDKVEYGPKIYEPWKSFKKSEEEIDRMANDLPEQLLQLTGEKVNAEEYNKLPLEERRGLARWITQQMRSVVFTQRLKEWEVKIDKIAVIKPDDIHHKLVFCHLVSFFVYCYKLLDINL